MKLNQGIFDTNLGYFCLYKLMRVTCQWCNINNYLPRHKYNIEMKYFYFQASKSIVIDNIYDVASVIFCTNTYQYDYTRITKYLNIVVKCSS